MLNDLRPLTQEQRQDARHAAQEAVIRAVGDRPTREQFAGHSVSRYPARVTALITLLCIVLLLAAFTPSAIRLFTIGSQTFGQTINNTAAVYLVGIATVLSAETGQVVFSLAIATLGTTRAARRLLYTSMMIATVIALVGNVQLALPGHVRSPFAWLEAIAPPLLVLSTAYVLKGQMLEMIQQRHANEQAFQTALATWRAATADPESHPRWSQFYANAIRDALLKANNRRKDVLEAMTTADWRGAVYREIQSEEWFAGEYTEVRPMQPSLVTVSSNGNGHHNGNGAR